MQVMQVSRRLEKLEEKRLKLQRKKKEQVALKIKKAAKRNKTKRKRTKAKPRRRSNPRRVKFSETNLGRLILINAPLEYQMICDAVDPDRSSRRGVSFIHNTVKLIGYASTNPVFRTAEFRVALTEFRLYGLYPKSRKRTWCTRDALKASQSRQEQIRLQD